MTPDTELNAVQAPPGQADPARTSADGRPASPAPFMVTKEHRRFTEFADAVRRDRYIGLCYGAPGVGKTLSARHYAGWDTVEPYLRAFRLMESGPAPGQALASRSLVYTPAVANTPRTVDKGVTVYHSRLSWAIGLTLHPSEDLDTLTGIGLILIGMPGIEKRLARYPQLYSRVGFVHHYRPLSAQEQALVLARHWPELGLGDTSDFTTSETVAAITRITSGNFRLTCRLVAQIQRVLDINHLSVVTREVVEAARESLVIGVM